MATSPTTSVILPQTITGAGANTARSRSRSLRKAVLVGFVSALVASAAYGFYARGRKADLGGADRYVASTKDFTVVLKEKGELKAAKSTDVVSEVEGQTRIISLIPEGTAVKEGDLLIELASDKIDERIRQDELKESNAITTFEAARSELEIQRDKNASDVRKAELKIELDQLALDRYQKGDWEQQRKDAEIAIQQAKINLDRRRQDYEASKQLRAQNFVTQTEYEEDEFNFKKAEWDVAKSEHALHVLVAYAHTSMLRQKESELQESTKEADRVRKNSAAEDTKKSRAMEGAEKELGLIRDQLTKLRTQKVKCRVVAPTKGFVVYAGGGGGFRMMGNDNQIKEGAEVFERQVLIELPDTSAMLAVVRVHEAKTDKLRVGQSATIEVEGVPGKRFPGKVSKIAVLADTQNRWLNPDLKEYETEITLDPSDSPLKPGVTAHSEILVETVEDRLAIPVQAVFSKAGKRFVFLDNGSEIAPREVSLGSIGTEWVEVSKGLAAGDRILLAASDEHKRLLPEPLPGERASRSAHGGPRGMGGPGGSAGGLSGGKEAGAAQPKDTAVVPGTVAPQKPEAANSPGAGQPSPTPAQPVKPSSTEKPSAAGRSSTGN